MYWYFVYYCAELVTCASAAACCCNYKFLKYLRKRLQLLSSLSDSLQIRKNSQPQEPNSGQGLVHIPSLCKRQDVFWARVTQVQFSQPPCWWQTAGCVAAPPSPGHQQSSSRLQNVHRRSLPSSPTTV